MKHKTAMLLAAALAGYLARSEVQRRRRISREDKRIGSLISEVLDVDAWMMQAVGLVRARMPAGEHGLSLAVFTEAADGGKTEWLARPGDTGPVVRKVPR